MNKDNIKRPICPNCNKEMKIVKVNSSNETQFFWDCECTIDFWINETYDREAYMR